MDYSQHYATRETPQTEQADPRQVENSAGGFSFQVDDWQRLQRFLILGSEGGSYYSGERELTRENAQAIERCLAADPLRTIKTIVEVSDQGRALKNDPAIFALALAVGTLKGPAAPTGTSPAEVNARAALAAIPKVCRTATHLFHFCQMVDGMRGWGRGLRRAVAAWYESKSVEQLTYQLAKYQQRDGWTHRDVFRLAHPQKVDQAVARWVVGAELGERFVGSGHRVIASVSPAHKFPRASKYPATGQLPEYLQAFEELKKADQRRTIQLIEKYRFTHEMIATEHKNSPMVWGALLPNMPMGALVRNLGKLAAVGLTAPLSAATQFVAERLTDRERLRKARVHPLALLSALRVYASGHGHKGSLTWTPVPQITDALNDAFYLAFDAVEPTGKRTLLALDVSGSMMYQSQVPGLTCRDVSAALAMVTARVEKEWGIFGFSTNFVELNISRNQRLDDVIRVISNLPFAGTDCSLPMLYAGQRGMQVDVFHVYTDNETWAGNIHPHQALVKYRESYVPNAKLAVLGMVSNGFTIADPSDPGMLDLVGCSTDTPAALAEFARL